MNIFSFLLSFISSSPRLKFTSLVSGRVLRSCRLNEGKDSVMCLLQAFNAAVYSYEISM